MPSFTIYYCHILESSRVIYCVQLMMHNINITLHYISRLYYFAWMCLFFSEINVNFLLLFYQFMTSW